MHKTLDILGDIHSIRKIDFKNKNFRNKSQNINIKYMNIPGNFIAKRIGSAIGAQAFNNQTSSCDGLNKQGQPCCYNLKDAQKKVMPLCSWKSRVTKKN